MLLITNQNAFFRSWTGNIEKTAITCDITGELSVEKDKILTRIANFNVNSDLYDSSVISSLTEKSPRQTMLQPDRWFTGS